MFENYKATQEDFEAIEEGIKTVWHPEMDFIFKKKKMIENVIVVSYDSRFLYLWTKIELSGIETMPSRIQKYKTYKIPHKVKLKDEWQLGWRVSLTIREFEKFLPQRLQKSNFEIPKISGGLLTPFIELQKREKGTKLNPYITYESYLATIVHEFGHIYYGQHKLWWFSNKAKNLTYLKTALKLYREEKISKYPEIKIPRYSNLTETFAFCVDYAAASFFWPNHKKDIDKANISVLKRLTKEERKKNLDMENSVFDGWQGAHYLASTLGKIILHQYPTSWPEKILAL